MYLYERYMKSGGVIMKFGGLDFSHTVSLLDGIQESMNASQNTAMAAMEFESRMKAEQRQAVIETAENTAEMKGDLKTVIHNQNDYISMLKEQNEYIKQVLNNMFGSAEDSVIVQKEILKIMQESKPSDGLVADKSLDVAIQLAFNAISIYLKSKGIFF